MIWDKLGMLPPIKEVVSNRKVNDHNELWQILLYYLIDYNFRAPQRVLGGLTPYEKMLEWHEKERELFVCDPQEYFGEVLNKFVNQDI